MLHVVVETSVRQNVGQKRLAAQSQRDVEET